MHSDDNNFSNGEDSSSNEDECEETQHKQVKVDPRYEQIERALQKEDFAVQDGGFSIEYTRPGSVKEEIITQMVDTVEANMKHYYSLPNVNEKYGWVWDKENLRHEISEETSRYILCYSDAGNDNNNDNKKLMGFIVAKFETKDLEDNVDDGWCIYVYEIHTTKEGKGKGIGTRLLRVLEGLAASFDGATMLRLTCFLENSQAMSFYRKNGFVLDPDSPSPLVFKDVPHAILRKVLKNTN